MWLPFAASSTGSRRSAATVTAGVPGRTAVASGGSRPRRYSASFTGEERATNSEVSSGRIRAMGSSVRRIPRSSKEITPLAPGTRQPAVQPVLHLEDVLGGHLAGWCGGGPADRPHRREHRVVSQDRDPVVQPFSRDQALEAVGARRFAEAGHGIRVELVRRGGSRLRGASPGTSTLTFDSSLRRTTVLGAVMRARSPVRTVIG